MHYKNNEMTTNGHKTLRFQYYLQAQFLLARSVTGDKLAAMLSDTFHNHGSLWPSIKHNTKNL